MTGVEMKELPHNMIEWQFYTPLHTIQGASLKPSLVIPLPELSPSYSLSLSQRYYSLWWFSDDKHWSANQKRPVGGACCLWRVYVSHVNGEYVHIRFSSFWNADGNLQLGRFNSLSAWYWLVNSRGSFTKLQLWPFCRIVFILLW